MAHLSDSQFATVICWLFAVYFAFDELFHLLRTLYLLVHCKLHGKSETLDPHWNSWYLIAISISLLASTVESEQLPLVPTFVCISGWLFIPLCVILQRKLVSMKSWRGFLEDVMERFFRAFELGRRWLLQIEKYKNQCPPIFKLVVLLIGVGFMCFAAINGTKNPTVVYIADIGWILSYVIFGACAAIQSCKKLLKFWFWQNIMLSCTIVIFTPSNVEYIIFVIVFSLIWIVMAGMADNDVAKMAATIVNTGTTILVILINVLVGWGLNCLGEQALFRDFLEQLQYYGNLVLLPLIVSGYLSALLKEMQIYRCARREKREQQEKQNQDGEQLYRR